MTTYDFAGKVVLVTGSSRGIGAAILTRFAHAKARCVLHFLADNGDGPIEDGPNGRDAMAMVAKLDGIPDFEGVHLEAADVTDAKEVERMFGRVKSTFGRLDVLVNNAGVLRDRTLKRMTLDDWQAVVSTNLTGVFHCCKYGSEVLADGGRIVNIASVAGLVGFPGQANYAAAKAGVIGMTRSLAKELARRRITVNAVAPGIIETAMMADIKPEMRAEYIKQIPAGRFGTPDDVANAVLFLASADSEYVTGQVLPVTGGWV
jgi:3-oxoacyl-[acyl-carrier protein] reductase